MSETPDSTLADSEQLIADLQRQLADCRAERDEGLQRETATRSLAGHQFLARRPHAGVRCHAGESHPPVRGCLWHAFHL